MKKLLIVCAVLLGTFTNIRVESQSAVVTRTNTVTLAWDASCDSTTAGYIVHYGLTNNPTTTNIVAAYTNDCGVLVGASTNIYHGSNTNRFFIPGYQNNTTGFGGLLLSNTYSFTVTMTNSSGVEGPVSSEVMVYLVSGTNAVAPPPPVSGFIIKSTSSP